MAIASDLWFDWTATTTGLLTNAKLTACADFVSLPLSDPTFIYQGPSSTFETTYIVDDAGTFPALPFQVTVDGTPVSTGGGKAMAFDYSNPVLEYTRVYFHGGSSPEDPIQDILKFGYVIFSAANATGSLNNLDSSAFYDPFAILQQRISNTSNDVIAHVQSNNGPAITITPDMLLFYEILKKNSTNELKIRFRDPNDNFSIFGESETTFAASEFGTYTDQWGCASSHPDCTGRTYWGNSGYVYGATDFIAGSEFGGVINATTANFTTLTVG